MRRGPTREELDDYRELKHRLWEGQEGRCAGCDGRLPLQLASCDLIHLEALGMGRSRYDTKSRLNDPSNLRLMHRPCHEKQEAEVREEHRRWRDDY
jgi:hypothetical protein